MLNIFISYAKKDTRGLAFALADALATLDGVNVCVPNSVEEKR